MNAPIDVTNIRIETERLILRPWRESDLPDFYEYASVDGVGQMAGWLPHGDIETSRKILTSFINHKKVLALELKEDHKVIGSVGIEELDHVDELPQEMKGRELGYVLGKAYWGRGLMPEAVAAVIDYCFGELGCDYLTCCHFAWNSQSRRVIEKSGFHFLKEIDFETQLDTHERSWQYIRFKPFADGDALPLQPPLETERLILRRFRDEDAADCFAFLSDRESCYLDGGYEPFSQMDWEYWWLMEKFKGQRGRLMLQLRDTGAVIGTLNVRAAENRAVKTAELGYVVSPAYRRQGYATEAIRCITGYLFEGMSTQMVIAQAVPHNAASLAMLDKLGFTCEGIVHNGFSCPDVGTCDLKSYYLEK